MRLPVHLDADSYDIILERGSISRASQYLALDRNVYIVTDDGVPKEYAQIVAAQCRRSRIHIIPQGEASKNLARFQDLLSGMLKAGLTREDCVVAVGGGVVGDLAGFAAACYMRGIDFYNIPTTLLAQVDSSIGGKTAVDLDGIKNIVGAFHQPRNVLIDLDLLSTLPGRQIANGAAEAIKMALCFDEASFALFESDAPLAQLDRIVENALRMKRSVVEQDEKEHGLRRVLNFGHTLGHGIESLAAGELLHGECVALGMLPMCSGEVHARLLRVLKAFGLPTHCPFDADRIMEAAAHDKKRSEDSVNVVLVEKAGTFTLRRMGLDELRARCVQGMEAMDQ